jgi:ABC-type transport system involved in cytochrome bd biosynthesis fused ATPase/permease subunit
MTISRYVRLFAGSFVLLSLALGAPGSPVFRSQNWLFFTGFVGFMLAQSAVTGICPMAIILKALGVKGSAAPAE